MMPFDAEVHFRIVVSGGIGILLARKGTDHAGILVSHWRQLVTAVSARDLDTRPFPSKIDSGGGLDHLVDVRAAHPGRAFEKIKVTVFVSFDELRVCDSA